MIEDPVYFTEPMVKTNGFAFAQKHGLRHEAMRGGAKTALPE